MAEESDNYVYVVEADLEAVKRAVRRLRILLLAPIPVISAAVILVATVAWLDGHPPSFSNLLQCLLILPVLLVGTAYFVIPRCVKNTYVTIAGDLITAPVTGGSQVTAVVKYKDVLRVKLDISKDRIVGATVVARGFVVVRIERITDPAIVVRAIFERGPDNIRWRRRWRPFSKLSREQVKTLIETSQAPSLQKLLPPSATLAQADDIFLKRKGWRDRRSGQETPKAFNAISWKRPTGVSRYVTLMLLQMFEDDPPTRMLRQSEPLPVLTFQTETAEPPPLADVLSHFKDKCGLNSKKSCNPTEGTIYIMIQHVPCKVLCRFDDTSEVCCQLRLERTTEQELNEASPKRSSVLGNRADQKLLFRVSAALLFQRSLDGFDEFPLLIAFE